MAGLFDRIEKEAFKAGITPRSKESIKWFQTKAKAMGKGVKRSELLQDNTLKMRNVHGIGNMYMYFYQPKHKEKLPYYDTFPLTIVIGPAKGGFMGLNLHYLPMTLRAKFLDSLLEITNNTKFNSSTKFELSYELLQNSSKLKYFEPCLKHYLKKQVRSRYALVPAPEWEIAAFLPTADFQKKSQSYVHKESRERLKR